MHSGKGLVRIEQETIGIYLGDESRPLIIACLVKDRDLAENIGQLQSVSASFEKEKLLVSYTLDDMLPYFSNRFNVRGTPTYLLIANGIVLGTLLGKNSGIVIVQFVHEMLSGYKPTKKTCSTSKSGKPAQKNHQKRLERTR